MKVNGYVVEKVDDGTYSFTNPYTGTAEVGYPTLKDAKADAAVAHRPSWYDNPHTGDFDVCDHANDYCAYTPATAVR